MTQPTYQRCWAEVNLDSLAQNFETAQALAGGAQLFAVVKANAYGHGDVAVAKTFRAAGARAFAVACLAEATRLRRAGIDQPILILGHTPPQAAGLLAHGKITTALDSLATAKALSDQAQAEGVTVEVHVKIDTGMGRIGFCPRRGIEEAAADIAQAIALPGLRATGVFTHFAVADSTLPADIAYTREQFWLLESTLSALEQKGLHFPLRHCCNSAGLVAYPRMLLDGARPGIILYGCPPSDEVPCPGLAPTLAMKATVALVKEVEKGAYVSYGRTWQAPSARRLATITAGYADGYPRALSGKGVCGINGQPAPVVGRVCMDQMMVDVTDCGPVAPGDTVALFGGAGADTLEEAARKAGTIPHEIMCGLGPRVARIYLRAGEAISSLDYMERI